MEFFNNAVTVLQTLVVALGAGLGIWEQSIFWKGMAMITLVRMLMCGKVTHKNLDRQQPIFRKKGLDTYPKPDI